MSIKSLMVGAAAGAAVPTTVKPEGVDFDGVNDYLSRSIDLVGNTDSKTFTFSAWVYLASDASSGIYGINSSKFAVSISAAKDITLVARDSSSTVILNVTANTAIKSPKNTWVNVLVSCDLSDINKRHIYLSDINDNGSWNTYSDRLIDFTETIHTISSFYTGGVKLKGRLSNVFLDYTYRDLSIEANRRLFTTADGKPTPTATLKALNPILYLPMKDAATAHINEGTGGNFTLNGTLATADRGANQDNCVASYFDGSDDYLGKASVNFGNHKVVIFSAVFSKTTRTYSERIFEVKSATSYNSVKFFVEATNGMLSIGGYYNNTGSPIIAVNIPVKSTLKRTNHISFSIDLEDPDKLIIALNGTIVEPANPPIITNSFIQMINNIEIGRDHTNSALHQGNIGELYFDTNYIDLATSNPFWDSETNKPIPVRKAMEALGSNPLICMPINASNPTKNYGSGGDFTLNGGGLTGARGASEFIAMSGYLDKYKMWLTKGAFSGSPIPTTTISIVAHIYPLGFTAGGYSNNCPIFECSNFTLKTSEGGLEIYSPNRVHVRYLSKPLTLDMWHTIFCSIDLVTNKKILSVYRANGTKVDHASNDYLLWYGGSTPWNWSASTYAWVGANPTYVGPTQPNQINSYLSNLFVTTDYIDFSQESNRNLFVNQLGYPRDLSKEIEAGTIPKPLIYLPFDDPTNLGKNLGTGGDFTVNGTVTQGADFSL